MGANSQVFEKNQSRVRAASLVVVVHGVAGTLVDPHHADVRTAPQRTLHPRHRVIRARIGPQLASVHVHNTEFKVAQRSRNLGTPIDRNFDPGYRVNSNLAAEEEQVSTIST